MSFLRSVLRTNAVYSLITGSIAIVFASRLGETMGINTWIVVAVGAGVLLFGVTMLIQFKPVDVDLQAARFIVGADLAWVVAAVAVVAFDILTVDGDLILGLVSVPVGLFAILQYAGIRGASREATNELAVDGP